MLEVQVSSLDQIYNWLKRTFKLDIDHDQVGINIETLQTPENGYFLPSLTQLFTYYWL